MGFPATNSLGAMRCRDRLFRWGERTFVMGILNVTPDSFSGDGLGADVEATLARARQFLAEGADLLDVGGESNRPGHVPISVEEELRRVLPVLRRLRAEIDAPLSIDTYKLPVAEQALDAGADLINDIWGLKRTPDLARLAAERGVPIALMHNQEDTAYRNLMPDLLDSLRHSIDRAVAAGVPFEQIIVDPGIGFGKTAEHNLEVLARLAELKPLGRPILLGPSRKSTIGKVLNLPVHDRVEGTAATVAIGIAHGADMVRVHDVRAMVRVVRMADAIVRGPW